MKAVYIDDEINTENVKDWIREINAIDDEEIRIYFNSEGGWICDTFVLKDYLETLMKAKDLTVVVTWGIHSAAFLILYWLNCKKIIYPQAHAAIHLMNYKIGTIYEKQDRNIQIVCKKQMEDANEHLLETFKEMGFTQEEMELISKGEDVYIGADRIRQIVCNQDERIRNSLPVVEEEDLIRLK